MLTTTELDRVTARVLEVRARAPFLLPAVYTPALSADFLSDGPALRRFVAAAWRTVESPGGIQLDRWQSWLIDRVLERYPLDHPDPSKAGRLRFRQVVISMPRQNGKSILGAVFALYGLLMHEPGPIVVGVASTAEQARVIYDRVLYVIQSNPDLSRQFSKMTETRGIKTKDGAGQYFVRASKGSVVQGIPVSLPIVDELHITKPPVWNGLVQGTKTKNNGLVLGITTAGDDDSTLLKFLYGLGERSAELDPAQERFGFFCWHAPEALVPENDDDLAEAIMMASPGHFEGRLDVGVEIALARTTPEQDVIRYTLNRFVASHSTFLPIERHIRNYRDAPFPDQKAEGAGGLWFAVDRTPDWGYGTVTANIKLGPDVHTEIVAGVVAPTLESLADMLTELGGRHDPAGFIMDGYGLGALADEMRRRGFNVHTGRQSDMLTASSLMYAKTVRGTLKHSGDELLARQIPHTVRKNVGEGFRISRRDSATAIDAVIATALGVFAAEIIPDTPVQVF